MVQLVNHIDVDEVTAAVPNTDTVVNAQARAEGSGKDELSARAPFADARVAPVKCEEFPFAEVVSIPNIDRSTEVSKPCKAEQTALRVEGDEVAR